MIDALVKCFCRYFVELACMDFHLRFTRALLFANMEALENTTLSLFRGATHDRLRSKMKRIHTCGSCHPINPNFLVVKISDPMKF